MYRRIFERILWCGLLSAALWCAGERAAAEDSPAEPDPRPAQDAAVAPDAGAAPDRLWDRANTAYVNGDYAGAIAIYESILDRGLSSARLYYNLGNAYFQGGPHGQEAILFYRRALRLRPGNEDVRHNLEVAEARTKDDIESIPEFFLTSRLREVRRTMGCTAWSVLSLGFLAAAAALPAALPAGAAARAAQGGILRHAGGGGSLRGRHVVRRARTARHAAPRRGGGHGRILGREKLAGPGGYRPVRAARGYGGARDGRARRLGRDRDRRRQEGAGSKRVKWRLSDMSQLFAGCRGRILEAPGRRMPHGAPSGDASAEDGALVGGGHDPQHRPFPQRGENTACIATTLSDAEVCPVCADEERDRTTICVVEQVADVLSIENTRQYRGLYHVLGA